MNGPSIEWAIWNSSRVAVSKPDRTGMAILNEKGGIERGNGATGVPLCLVFSRCRNGRVTPLRMTWPNFQEGVGRWEERPSDRSETLGALLGDIEQPGARA